MAEVVYVIRKDGLMFTGNGCPVENNIQRFVLELGNRIPKPQVVGRIPLYCPACGCYTRHIIINHVKPSGYTTIQCECCGTSWLPHQKPEIVP